jgi:hypothetical protein
MLSPILEPPSTCFRSVRMGREYVRAAVVPDDIEIPLGVKRLAQITLSGEDALGVIDRSSDDFANG